MKKELCVIGIDPGLASTGYGIIRNVNGKLKIEGQGLIKTSPHCTQALRLQKIFTELTQIIEEYRPTEAGVETLYFAKNISSALPVAEARGVVLLALAQHHVLVGEHTPNNIKKAVSGVTSASKEQVQEAVRFLLGLKEIPKPHHVADALAVAITHIHASAVMPASFRL